MFSGGVCMISFIICLALLIGGYFVYGKVVENTFAPDDRETPAVRINDGVDYVVMPQWKLFLVQLLNIAGLGPIFVGACGLVLIQLVPIIFNGWLGASVSFGGTSLIIIVSVILETLKQIESQMLVRNYKGFLNK